MDGSGFGPDLAQTQEAAQTSEEVADAALYPGAASFAVCDVNLGPPLRLVTAGSFEGQWARMLEVTAAAPVQQVAVEAMSKPPERAVFANFKTENMLAKAVHIAFYKHYPIRLSPDAIWIAIVQGLAQHVSANPEGLRHHFVKHEGKEKITISRPEFVKGSPDNDWPGVFPEFAQKIAEHVGQAVCKTIENNFSTTTPTDMIVSHIALMDTMKNYFEYEMSCGCGIPAIELLGTLEDWKAVRAKPEQLRRFDLEWWTCELLPVLDHFVLAAQGIPDIKFWKSVCNLSGASGFGRTPLTGWVQVFFPYNTEGRKNERLLGQWRKSYDNGVVDDYREGSGYKPGDPGYGCGYGMQLDTIPSSISQAPFKYVDAGTGETYDMSFDGGLVAIVQDPVSLALEPITGWAVLEHLKPGCPSGKQQTTSNKQKLRKNQRHN